MCGIAGIYGYPGVVQPDELVRMRDSQVHRGPDSDGLFVTADRRAGLAFRRLSIVDLSVASNQPLHSRDSRFSIVFNGEVFNFRELRNDLQRHGYEFKSQGDAEVVLYAFAHYGADCLQRFHGMFAFAIWDDTAKELFLARDRFGIKPLYYFHDDEVFLFASELKALLQHRRVSAAVDRNAFQDYLTYGYVPADRAIISGVTKLLPAHWLRVTSQAVTRQKYWHLQYEPDERSDQSVYDDLRGCMEDAVKLWMVSDVDVGAFLSGGIDSSSVCLLAQRDAASPLKTFSIGFDDARRDETRFARVLAGVVGTQHAERRVTLNDARTGLQLLSRVYDEPMVDTSCLPTLAVSRFASESVKVALTGDGADELFFGYGWYQGLIAAAARRPATMLDPAARWLIRRSRSGPWLARITSLERYTSNDVVRQYFLARGFFDSWEKEQLLGLDHYSVAQDDLWYWRQHFDSSLPLPVSLRLLDINTFLADDILPKVDRASMACSLEARTPLLDHKLAEFAFRIPERLVFKGGQLKHTMKAAMRDHLPTEILSRGKRGFSAPIVAWFNGPFAQEALDRVCNGYVAADGLISAKYVRRMYRNYAKGRTYKLWQLVVFEEWYKRWIRGVDQIPLDSTNTRVAVKAHAIV